MRLGSGETSSPGARDDGGGGLWRTAAEDAIAAAVSVRDDATRTR